MRGYLSPEHDATAEMTARAVGDDVGDESADGEAEKQQHWQRGESDKYHLLTSSLLHSHPFHCRQNNVCLNVKKTQ